MTKVIRKIRSLALILAAFVCGLPAVQAGPDRAHRAASAIGDEHAAAPVQSAEALYLQLRGVGLDKSRVYRVRDLSFDRAALHITLTDGIIAFTEDVLGKVTGAFFEGDGEVLLAPPDQVERASMTLFTGAAILEEQFVTAYFRFNDATYEEMLPALRPAENTQEFVTQWNGTARNLAAPDALRLLLSFSRLLPTPGQEQTTSDRHGNNDDRMLHARVQGKTLGAFDLHFDSAGAEQIWAGQLRTAGGASYYDVWTSFSPGPAARRTEVVNDVTGAQGKGDAITISHYKIQAEVKPPTELSADARLQMEVSQGGQRAVMFELSRSLQVKRVEVNGHPVEFIHNTALEGTQLERRGDDLIAVVFPRPLETGQELEVRFVYAGDVLSDAGKGLLYVGARGTWYPNRGPVMSNFDLEFRYPAGWTLEATGMRTPSASPGEKSAGGDPAPGEQVSRWISERAIPLAGFNLGKYSRVAARAGEVVVEAYATSVVERSFPRAEAQEVITAPSPAPGAPRRRETEMIVQIPPPSPAHNAQEVAETSARAIDFFARRFGPYPYSSLALTQMPGSLSQGWPGLIFLSSYSFLTNEEKSQLHMSPLDKIAVSNVIAHETAHQWWGDLVIWSGYRDQWLMEALANYSALMLVESENPAQFRAVMEKYRDDLLRKNNEGTPLMDSGPVTLGVRLSCSHFPAGYEAISYGRGTWLFHMLRYMFRDSEGKPGRRPGAADAQSDEPFVRVLRKLREQYEGKSVSTREVLRVFEEELPPSLRYEGRKSLDWFYQGWVNGTTVPRFELRAVKYSEKDGTTAVSGTLIQKDASKDLVTPVPLYAVRAGGTVLLGRVFADGLETPFNLKGPAGTRKIVVDPNQTLLARTK